MGILSMMKVVSGLNIGQSISQSLLLVFVLQRSSVFNTFKFTYDCKLALVSDPFNAKIDLTPRRLNSAQVLNCKPKSFHSNGWSPLK
jgi:hypothetical protein